MELYLGLISRTSQAVLIAPAPGIDVLEKCFLAALRAPDHRALQPWRYVVVQGNGRERLAEVFCASQRHLFPERSEEELQRLRAQPLRAPMLVIAVQVLRLESVVPEAEQVLSMGASVQNFLLALHAHGFAAIWRTGAMAVDPGVGTALGLAASERIAGIIYVGTCRTPRVVVLPEVQRFWSSWP